MTSMGRGGFRWKKLCQLVYATYGPVCYLCLHGIPGGIRTGQVDHVIAVSEDPSLRFELSNLRPVHGGRWPCPVCGHKCNQVKAGRSLMYAQRVLKTPKPGFPGSPLKAERREPGREWLPAKYAEARGEKAADRGRRCTRSRPSRCNGDRVLPR